MCFWRRVALETVDSAFMATKQFAMVARIITVRLIPHS